MRFTQKQAKIFVKEVTEGLLKLGAKISTDFMYQYEIETVAGKLWITFKDQSYLYSMFARFENPEIASKKFLCNQNSGKYNWFLSGGQSGKDAAALALSHIEHTLKKK